MLTSYVPSRTFDGIRCQAMGVAGCKYSIAFKYKNGETWNSGVNTIADARKYIEDNENIVKLVVYIYHSKQKTFEHIKTFIREQQ